MRRGDDGDAKIRSYSNAGGFCRTVGEVLHPLQERDIPLMVEGDQLRYDAPQGAITDAVLPSCASTSRRYWPASRRRHQPLLPLPQYHVLRRRAPLRRTCPFPPPYPGRWAALSPRPPGWAVPLG